MEMWRITSRSHQPAGHRENVPSHKQPSPVPLAEQHAPLHLSINTSPRNMCCAFAACLSVLLFMWFNACPKCAHVLKVRVKEQKVSLHIRGPADEREKRARPHTICSTPMCAKNPTLSASMWSHHRQWGRWGVKGVTLNSQTCPCFVFIAPVHFHNALKPLQRRRHGEKEKKSVEERDPGHTEK